MWAYVQYWINLYYTRLHYIVLYYYEVYIICCYCLGLIVSILLFNALVNNNIGLLLSVTFFLSLNKSIDCSSINRFSFDYGGRIDIFFLLLKFYFNIQTDTLWRVSSFLSFIALKRMKFWRDYKRKINEEMVIRITKGEGIQRGSV